ncbi:MAG: hypothetical protein ACI8UO_005996 [Verrucomicrobiales bacterium]|jgi:hypothetical protein
MLVSLILPIVLSAIALFFVSFLSWMVFKLHVKDWGKLEKEDEFMKSGRDLDLKPGSYMFPFCSGGEEMKSEEFQAKAKEGPTGIITVFPPTSMGRNLGLTFLFFLVVSFCLAYLTTLAHERGASFAEVFRFVTTAGLMTYLASVICHAIWFRMRIIGHIIESIAYAAITGAIFGAFWP